MILKEGNIDLILINFFCSEEVKVHSIEQVRKEVGSGNFVKYIIV